MCLCKPLTCALCCGGEALVHGRCSSAVGQRFSRCQPPDVIRETASVRALWHTTSSRASRVARRPGWVNHGAEERRGAAVPSDGNTRSVRARESSCLSRSSPLHSDTGDAPCKDAVFPQGLPSNAGGVVSAVRGRKALLHRGNASGYWTPRRGLFDTMYAVYLTGVCSVHQVCQAGGGLWLMCGVWAVFLGQSCGPQALCRRCRPIHRYFAGKTQARGLRGSYASFSLCKGGLRGAVAHDRP
jgi:hypothetical protein